MYRYLDNLAKLVDSMHILCSTAITPTQLIKGKELLLSYVNEFEQLYGEENMVYNVHQLTHIPECVENNGPLFLYSTYPMEDYIGYLVSLVHGTTDVTHQICEKYLLEKHLIGHLKKSCLAKKFYDEIQSELTFSVTLKIDKTLLIGKPKRYLGDSDLSLIREYLEISNDEEIEEYDSVLWNGEIFYERVNENRKKRTCDSFIFNVESNRFGEIKSIFVINKQVYFLVDEKYIVLDNPDNSTEHIIFLQLIDESESKITKSIGPKHAFVKFGNVFSCSKFPNLYERH